MCKGESKKWVQTWAWVAFILVKLTFLLRGGGEKRKEALPQTETLGSLNYLASWRSFLAKATFEKVQDLGYSPLQFSK